MAVHIPVLLKEVIEHLDLKSNDNIVDATIGEGGHALAILEKTKPFGKLLGIDWDKNQVNSSRLHLAEHKGRVVLVHDSYGNLQEIIDKTRFRPIQGIVIDLGFSSQHIESGRGFTFQKNEPLDMRYSGDTILTAEKIINEYSEQEIEKVLRELGEEKFSKQIARSVVKHRKGKKIKSTFELKQIIESAVPKKFQYGGLHIATRSFQAIRIAVNGELNNLTEFLPQALNVLAAEGRLVVISFHSLEDRIVKNFFKEKEKAGQATIITKKPVTASLEALVNPRSRSAKLRALIKT